jgi:hypothetical protein
VKDFVYFASFDEVYERSKADALEALTFVQKVGEVAETEGHHPDVNFGWGYATVSLRTKKIKGSSNAVSQAKKLGTSRAGKQKQQNGIGGATSSSDRGPTVLISP